MRGLRRCTSFAVQLSHSKSEQAVVFPLGVFGHLTAMRRARVAFQHEPRRPVNGEEGAHLRDGTGRSHLPLRGKLGWMTP